MIFCDGGFKAVVVAFDIIVWTILDTFDFTVDCDGLDDEPVFAEVADEFTVDGSDDSVATDWLSPVPVDDAVVELLPFSGFFIRAVRSNQLSQSITFIDQ